MSTTLQPNQSSPSLEEETAKRVRRELLRAHVLITAAEAEETERATTTTTTSHSIGAAAAAAAAQEELTTPAAKLLASCALSHNQLAIALAGSGHREQQPDLSERAFLAKALSLRRLGFRRQSAVVEITAAARVEGLAIDGELVGGAEWDKVLDLWERYHGEEGAAAAVSPPDDKATEPEVTSDQDPYWDYVFSPSRTRAGNR